ncbi:Retrovirus-related Pol polyprotein from type-1 retrotransposable element R2 [Sesamum angolense]|uniref:Retrovirus-related Pol polyprotein from type-1 retrotransposable element R2 n=1 Tax=Sesamum angolense TaxID=2727404 RepID=A0AAE1WAV5_9LAMI|nr:Retrovirus-related Pol polyprotein from type-1 retrotransposable element R2 [Sesamum angolense]
MGSFLTLKLASDLYRTVTPAEVKTAVFQISDNKVSGSDGYTSCFFKRAWNIVGYLVCRAVMDLFRSGRMLRQLNQTIIVLVPKSGQSPSVADYRLISCYNVIYKVMTKIIANCLPPHWNISLTVAKQPSLGTETSQIISSLLKKWFDSTRGNGFHLIVLLTSTYVRYLIRSHGRFSPGYSTVTLNGSLHGFSPGKKGLRQGDPMSPVLFILCMEFFSRLIKMNTSNSDFNFHPKCEKLKITHLLFADDLMLFSRRDLPSIHILMECLQEFRDVSSLAVNTSKSSIFTAGIQNDVLPGLRPSFGILREHRWPGKKFAIRRRKAVWAKWVNEVYLRWASLWDWQPKKGDSPLLRQLAEIQDRIIIDFGFSNAAVQHMTEWSNSKGLVTSKAYEYFRPKLTRQPWKASIWKAFIPPKYSFILWLGLREKLATRDRLAFV